VQGLIATTEVFHSGSSGGGRGLAEAMSVPFLGQVCIMKGVCQRHGQEPQ
jgi:hypothetical protein